MKRKRWVSLLGLPVAGITSLVTGVLLAALLPPLPAFSFDQILLVSYRTGDSLPSNAQTVGSAAPMFYTTAAEGAHEQGGSGLRPTGVWAPGDQITRGLMIKNVDPTYMLLLEQIEVQLSGDLDIAPWYTLAVTTGDGQVLWSGRFGDFVADPTLPLVEPLSIALNGSQELAFTVGLDRETANPHQGKTIRANFVLHAREYVLDMDLDVHHNSWPNPINPGSKGSIPVAINGSDTFDVRQLDGSSARFGPNLIPPLRDAAFEDWNGDGYTDMILHFDTQTSGITCGMETVTLYIASYSGTTYEDMDYIKTPPCK